MKMFKALYRPVIAASLVAALAVNDAQALPESYYTTTSLLSSGKWVKVKVSQTGMQQLTFDQLRQLGFSNPENVAVYGYSGVDLRSYAFSESMADDLPAVPVAIYGEKLVFYGVGSEAPVENLASSGNFSSYSPSLMRNLQNACAYYFLTDSQPQLLVETDDYDVNTDLTFVSDAQGLVWKNFTDRQPGNIGAYLFGENLCSEEKTYSISLPDYNSESSVNPTMAYGACCWAQSPKTTFSIPGASTVSVSIDNYGNDSGHLAYRYKSGVLNFAGMTKTDDDVYELSVNFTKSTDITEGSLDYYLFSYPRNTDVSQSAQQLMAFSKLSAGQGIKLTNGDDDATKLKVWEVTTTSTPRELTVKALDEEGVVGFVADRGVTMGTSNKGLQTVVFNPERDLNDVEVIGEVANQNYHGMDVPDMLIVASPNCYNQALRLAEIHREKTGYDVAVVPFHEICNEFSSGLPHFMGVRRLAKMLYDRDPQKFKAILLFARAYHDNTGMSITESQETFYNAYIPMFQCENTSSCGEQPNSYSTDALYAMLDDDFVFDYTTNAGHFLRAPLKIKVGRIPAVNEGEAMTYLAKIENYLDNPSELPIYNRAMMLADMGDANLHLDQAQKMRSLISTLSPSTMVDMHLQSMYNPTYSNENMRTRIRQQLQRGVGLWLFLGHSTSSTYIGSGMLWSNAYDKETPNDNPVFTVYGTCQSQMLDYTQSSLQVDMLFHQGGGMIAGVGTARPAYAQYNYYLVNMMTRAFYSLKPGATFGDIYRVGRNIYAETPDNILSGIGAHDGVATNNMSYNFAGDPMLPMFLPEGSVKIAYIDEEDVEEDSNYSFSPLESHTFEGYVYDDNGDVDTSFNGQLTMLIYDGDHSVSSTVTDDKTCPVETVTFDDTLLQEVTMNVVEGKFSGEVSFANPAYVGDCNRITLFAVTDDLKRRSVGYFNGIKVNQDANLDVESSDDSAPVISSMYAVDEDYIESDYVPGDFTLYATVETGKYGLYGNSDRLGGGVSLILDDSRKLVGADACLKINGDGVGTLEYDVTELSDGPHALTLRVMNIAGVSTERTLNVTVVNVSDGTTVVDSSSRNEAVIDIEHSLSDAPAGRLLITDASGNMVFSKEVDSFPYTWNFTDNNEKAVADGVYSARVYFKSGRRYGSATPASIVVAR